MFPYQKSRQEPDRWVPIQGWLAFALLMILLGLSMVR